jgi:1-acyl-sn-glycerol-3-phosphate acyltransferase
MMAAFAFPFILAAPIYPALARRDTVRGFLVVSSSFCAIVAILAGFRMHGPNAGLVCLVGILLHNLVSAASSSARYSLVSAITSDLSWPSTFVLGWMQMGSAIGAVLGLILAEQLWLAEPGWPSLPGSIGPVILIDILATMAAYRGLFPCDRCQSLDSVSNFPTFLGAGQRIMGDAQTRRLLLAFAGSVVILTASAATLLSYTPSDVRMGEFAILSPIAMGLIVGSLLTGTQRHPYRVVGLAPLAGVGFLAALAWCVLWWDDLGPGILLGAMGAISIIAFRTAYQTALPDEIRAQGVGLLHAVSALGAVAVGLVAAFGFRFGYFSSNGLLWLLVVVTAAGTLFAGRIWRRELIEQVSEIVLVPIYRVHGHGPGLTQFPSRGPFLVVANHAAWFDPLWLGKIIPRPVYPMMTSRFYDLPVIRWLMKSVVHAIRVPEASFRREAPELKEAVAVLDRGQCLVIFPEGAMKRKDEKTLRQFGQGVWRILQERPQTPVMACWIEGGWGCFLSYWNGPPTKNKRFDFWRRIEIGFGPLQVLPAEVLEDQRAARGFLMHACLDARQYLGLPAPAIQAADDNGGG